MRLALMVGALLAGSTLAAQASLVPVDHPVYEWLHRQRVRGAIPRYDYEALPLTRTIIAGLLDSVAVRGGLPWADRDQLAWFRAEFTIDPADSTETLLQGAGGSLGGTLRAKAGLILSDREPHLFRHVGEDGSVTADYLVETGGFVGSEVRGASVDRFAVKHLRLYGAVYGRVGFHLEAINASGSRLFTFHPQWRGTREITTGQGSLFWAQGFASATYRSFRFDLGTGNQRLGPPGREAVVLRAYSPAFDWVRATLATPVLQYTWTHGTLQGPVTVGAVPGVPGAITATAPGRSVAIRRVQVRPWHGLQLAFTESMSYNSRGFDLAYANPVVPYFTAQFNTNDRDNWVSYLDVVIRPVAGVEVAGAVGVDDMNSFADWLRPTGARSKNDSTTKLLFQGWGTVALPTATDLFGGFVRVEPFFYTHRFVLNTLSQWDFPLGAEVGPNADEWTVGIRQWLPRRAWVRVSLSGGRHGLNPVDSLGNVTDVGGSVTSVHVDQRILFLAGDVHHTRTWRLDGAVEPVRGVRLDVDWQRRAVARGARLPAYNLLRVGASLMFYPVDLLVALAGG